MPSTTSTQQQQQHTDQVSSSSTQSSQPNSLDHASNSSNNTRSTRLSSALQKHAENTGQNSGDIAHPSSKDTEEESINELPQPYRDTAQRFKKAVGHAPESTLIYVFETLGGSGHFDTLVNVVLSFPGMRRSIPSVIGKNEVIELIRYTLYNSDNIFMRLSLGVMNFWVLSEYILGYSNDEELATMLRSKNNDDVDMARFSVIETGGYYNSLAGSILRLMCAQPPSPQTTKQQTNKSKKSINTNSSFLLKNGAGWIHEDDIAYHVVNRSNWFHSNYDVTSGVLRQRVRITLRTNPLFAQDPCNPGFWRPSELVYFAPAAWKSFPSFLNVAPEGFPVGPYVHGQIVCTKCEATIPGRGPFANWHVNIKDTGEKEVLCLSCFAKTESSNACVVCGKIYSRDSGQASSGGNQSSSSGNGGAVSTRSSSASSAAGNGEGGSNGPNAGSGSSGSESSSNDDGEWICCDECNRWVMVKCDPTIKDLHDYEESNPNHKKYLCPVCVEKQSKSVNSSSVASLSGGRNAGSSVMTASAGNLNLTRRCNTSANDDDAAQIPRKKRKGNNGQATSSSSSSSSNVQGDEENAISELFGSGEDAVLDKMMYQLSHSCDEIAVEMWKEGAFEGVVNANSGLPSHGQLTEIISQKMSLAKRMKGVIVPRLNYHRSRSNEAKKKLEKQRNDILVNCRKALEEFIEKKKRKKSSSNNNNNSAASSTSSASSAVAQSSTAGSSSSSISTNS